MSQVIIFKNDNGGVSVCIPTGEISIEAVKFDRVTLAHKLREAGHPELIKLLEE